eukprot:529678_1
MHCCRGLSIVFEQKIGGFVARDQLELTLASQKLEIETRFSADKQELMAQCQRDYDDRLRSARQDLQREFTTANERSKQQMENIKAATDQLNEKFMSERKLRLQAESDLSDEKRNLVDGNNAMADLKTQIAELQHNKDMLSRHLDEGSRNIGRLKQLLEQQRSENASIQPRMNEQLQRSEALETQLGEEKTKYATSQQKITDSENELTRLRGQLRMVSEQQDSLKDKYENLKRVSLSKESSHETDIRRLTMEKEILESEHKKMKSQVSSLDKSVSSLRDENRNLTRQLSDTERNLSDMTARREKMASEIRGEVSTEMSSVKERAERSQIELRDAKRESQKTEKRMGEKESYYLRKVSDLQDEIGELQKKQAAISAFYVNRFQQVHSSFLTKITSVRQIYATLRTEVDTFRNNMAIYVTTILGDVERRSAQLMFSKERQFDLKLSDGKKKNTEELTETFEKQISDLRELSSKTEKEQIEIISAKHAKNVGKLESDNKNLLAEIDKHAKENAV